MNGPRWLLAVAWLVVSPLSARAAPEPIVFDFEDGLQGWELEGAATRVQTQILGGQWAIFGDGRLGCCQGGNAAIAIDLDPTELQSISIGLFFVGSFVGPVPNPVLALLSPSERGVSVALVDGQPLDPTANPGTWLYDASGLGPLSRIELTWGLGLIFPFGAEIPSGDSPLAFIDNITFHPVPEPSTLGLLSLGLATLAILRRRMI